MTIHEQIVNIPKTQPSLRDSQRCLASATHKGFVEGRLAVLALLEVVIVDPLHLPS
jgi:hypothetical protein